jgi:hypothetical protein
MMIVYCFVLVLMNYPLVTDNRPGRISAIGLRTIRPRSQIMYTQPEPRKGIDELEC